MDLEKIAAIQSILRVKRCPRIFYLQQRHAKLRLQNTVVLDLSVIVVPQEPLQSEEHRLPLGL